jgi:hypothetical protein
MSVKLVFSVVSRNVTGMVRSNGIIADDAMAGSNKMLTVGDRYTHVERRRSVSRPVAVRCNAEYRADAYHDALAHSDTPPHPGDARACHNDRSALTLCHDPASRYRCGTAYELPGLAGRTMGIWGYGALEGWIRDPYRRSTGRFRKWLASSRETQSTVSHA